MNSCIVLNADYSFLNVIDYRKALKLVALGKVEIVKYSTKIIKTVITNIKIPIIIRLIKLVRTIFKRSVPFTRKNIFVRDNHTCVYCGTIRGKLTIDHVMPRSKGGKDSFENCVTACSECNEYKGDKTLNDAQMYFNVRTYRPHQPTIAEFIRLKWAKHSFDFDVDEVLSTLMTDC